MKLVIVFYFLGACAAWWAQDESLRANTMSKSRLAPKQVTVNLDLPPLQRWSHLKGDADFANFKEALNAYLRKFVPSWAVPVVADIVSGLKKSFGDDYADEAHSLAEALGVSTGDIVIVNLIYQLEDIGVSCDKRNVTGPCPPKLESPGLCTGVIGHDENTGNVWQGRNLDWNLDESLLQYVLEVDYRKGGKTIFKAAQVAGEVGAFHGMSLQGGFAIQMNARNTGGNLMSNLLALIAGHKTPSMVLRRALEEEIGFGKALNLLSTEKLANPVYYIASGMDGKGAILSRERNDLVDAWHLNENSTKDAKHINPQPDWLRLQTNYDHWIEVPDYDDRRHPGIDNMNNFCHGSPNAECTWKVITTWPTFNHHTDVSAVMCPKTGYFNMTIWKPSQQRKKTTFVV